MNDNGDKCNSKASRGKRPLVLGASLVSAGVLSLAAWRGFGPAGPSAVVPVLEAHAS